MTIIFIFISAAALAGKPAQVIPTTYEAGHFFATPETADGQRVRLLVDTGGGGAGALYWLVPQAAERLRLKPARCHSQYGDLDVTTLPVFRPDKALPAPLGPCQSVLIVREKGATPDGMLGSPFLAGRIWTFDYPARKLTLESQAWKPSMDAHALPMGFQTGPDHKPARHFPGIDITVAGETLPMLLDTGATARPTQAGRDVAGTEAVNGIGTTSYITHGQLERWHQAHPDWRVLDGGDDMLGKPTRMIEVPALDLAGWTVGPVWFTERPDANFHGMMASIMDRTPEGAIGANVFRHFVMTLDYPKATAYLRCVENCRPTAKEQP